MPRKTSKGNGNIVEQPAPKVWVVNWAGHDYSPAKEYGELNWLTRGYVSLGNLDRLFYTVAEAVSQTHKDDFLLPAGLAILNVVAAAVWLRIHGSIRILVWDQKHDHYRELTFNGEQIDDLNEVLSEEAPKV